MKHKKVNIAGIAMVLVALTAAWAHAQGHIQLKSVAQVEKEVFNQEGKKELKRMPADKVVPGDEVIFTTYYTNISKETVEHAVITNPVPKHMVYKVNSAQGSGAKIEYSVDDGKTYNTPTKLFVYDAAGRQFPARPQDYTHIRWTFETPVAAGAKGEVSFRAILK